MNICGTDTAFAAYATYIAHTAVTAARAAYGSKLQTREGCAHCRRLQGKIAVGLCRGMLRRRFPKSHWGMGQLVRSFPF